MGNLFSFSSRSRNNNPPYELFLSTEQLPEQNHINQRIDADIRLLRLDIARLDSRITELQNGMQSALYNVNEKLNEKFNDKINITGLD
jgi:alpha-galactosidase